MGKKSKVAASVVASLLVAACNFESQTTDSNGQTTDAAISQYTIKAPGTVLSLYCGIAKADKSGVVAWYLVKDATVGSYNFNSAAATPVYAATFSNLFSAPNFLASPQCRPAGIHRQLTKGYTTSYSYQTDTFPSGPGYNPQQNCNGNCNYLVRVTRRVTYHTARTLDSHPSLIQVRVKSTQEVLPVFANLEAKNATQNCVNQNSASSSDVLQLTNNCVNSVGGGYQDLYFQENWALGTGATTAVNTAWKCSDFSGNDYIFCTANANSKGYSIY